MSAAAAGLIDVVECIGDFGPNMNYFDPTRKMTALMCAAKNSRIDVCDWLIKNGADPTLKV